MTKSIFLLSSIFFAVLINSSNALAQKKVEKQIIFEYVDPLKKVFPETSYFPSEKATADVARGEHASFQFVLRSGLPMENVSVTVGAPVNGNGKLGIIKTGFVGFVPVDRPTPRPGRDYLKSVSGYYPDPILEDPVIDVKPTVTQPIWVSVKIPENAETGNYLGEVIITGKLAGKKFSLSKTINIQVFEPVIRKTSLWVTNWYSIDNLSRINAGVEFEKYSDDYWKYARIIAKKMAEYRQNVVLISPLEAADFKIENGQWSFDFTNFNKLVNIMIEEEVVGRIEGGHIGGRGFQDWSGPFVVKIPREKEGKWELDTISIYQDEAKNFYGQFFPALETNLKDNGWLDIYMQHIADEPIGSNRDSYIEITTFVKSLVPDMKIVEACHTRDLDGVIDIWVPQLNFLNDDFDFYREQMEQGKEVWFYTCLAPQENYANRFIQQPLIKTRILHWINYKYAIPGYLHWGLNKWRVEDPFKMTSVMNYAGNTLPSGDFAVLYPGKGKLLSSIRLEAMRDGIVDYELLKMLEQKNPDKAKELAGKIVFRFNHYDINILHFREIRRQILELLSE